MLTVALLTIALFLIIVLLAMMYRTVVSTNDVHIVQGVKTTTSYGKDQVAGNVYYAWPSWVPLIGIKVIKLPVSVFDVNLNSYAAYDKGRVPFTIDIMAFFRIEDSNVAAQRVHSFDELMQQLKGILQGASRSILAKSEIEQILEERSRFGGMFTDAVSEQLKAWGVVNVKNIELMDIRDAEESKVIANIMAKKKSLIEMQSRTEVANNIRAAQEAEIAASRQVQIRQQEAQEQVGVRTAEKDKAVGISNQQAAQAVKEQEKLTAEKAMAVLQVQEVRKAEIQRSVQVVAADQQRQQTVIVAEGNLEQAKLHAQGVEVEGRAKGEAEKAVLLAPVNAQITLAKEIGSNDGYQKYLLGVRGIEAHQSIGVEQAHALEKANIKVIANAGNAAQGLEDARQLFSAKGGTQIGAMLEAVAQTEMGAALMEKFTGKNGSGKEAP